MFSVDTVRSGLDLLEKGFQEQLTASQEAYAGKVEEVRQDFRTRRSYASDALHKLAAVLGQGGTLTRDALQGRVQDLPDCDARDFFLRLRGNSGWHLTIGELASVNTEEATILAIRKESENQEAALERVRHAIRVMKAYQGSTVSVSGWERMHLDPKMLSGAVSAAVREG